VLELADIFRLHGSAFSSAHPLLPSQRKALTAIVRCRTAALGGQHWQCDRDDCDYEHYSYHSCGNRHCPKCHGQQTQRWLEKQRGRLLPCTFYFATITLPSELRALVYAHQKPLYDLLLNSAAAAVQKLAWDQQWVGGQLAVLAVLHTWTQTLLDHPHVHLLITAGGLSRDGQAWCPAKNRAFLFPGYALAKLFQGKFKAGLKKFGWLNQTPPQLWQRPWKNVQIQPAGRGQKVLDYLGRYAFRIAINNSRLQQFENGQVTFGYRDRKTGEKKSLTLSAEEFIRRFLRHVLPKGFVKVRSYGLWAATNGAKLQTAQALLTAATVTSGPDTAPPPPAQSPNTSLSPSLCPKCRSGHLICVAILLPQHARAP
jgi:hypothetical protein